VVAGDADLTVAEALAFQREGCANLGSPLYSRLLAGLEADHAAGGLTAELLEGRTTRPAHDALALRYLGAVHRIVLEGRAPELARFYPSVGGHPDGDPTPTFLEVVAAHRPEVETGLGRGVQTNEVRRAAALAPGFALIARRTGRPLRLREVGSSAGLLLRWDRYGYTAAGVELGDMDSPLVFDDAWLEPVPDLRGPVVVADRRGCDVAPIDAGSEDGRLTLLSFVWPDQAERFHRLRAALDIAAHHPVAIDRADAADWVEQVVGAPSRGTATVIFHSIVLHYLSVGSRRRMRASLLAAGEAATEDAPILWLRLEPAGAVADLRLTSWPGGAEEVLCTAGYHGGDVRWGRPR
jgi:hypothetical protein